jgi:hypothetical protein
MLSLNKEKALELLLNDSVLKEFEKMVDGNFIPVNYAVIEDKDAVIKDKDAVIKDKDVDKDKVK